MGPHSGARVWRTELGPRGDVTQPHQLQLTVRDEAMEALWSNDLGSGSSSVLRPPSPTFNLSPPQDLLSSGMRGPHDAPLRSLSERWGEVQGLISGKACEAGSYLQEMRHPAAWAWHAESEGTGILGPRYEAPNFSGLPRGLQGCCVNKCKTREFFCLPHHCADGEQRPREGKGPA